MVGKQASFISAGSDGPANPHSRQHQPLRRGEVIASLTLLAFFVVLAGYLVLFFSADLPSMGRGMSRFDLLKWRLFLPEQAMAHWFGTPADVELRDRLPVLYVAAATLAFGWLCGWLTMTTLRFDTGLTRLERGVFACGVGLNMISLYTLAVGLTVGLSRAYFLIPAVALVLAGCGMAWHRRRQADLTTATLPDRAVDWSTRGWLWLAAPFIATIVLGAMLPPVDFDVREYHLQAPKEFYLQGRIVFLPHNVYANMALGSEMLSLLCMVISGDWWVGALAGKTLIAAYAPLTALALVAAGRRFFSNTVGVIAAVVYLSIPWVSLISTSGLVEGASAFYMLASLYALLLWREAENAAAVSLQAAHLPTAASAGGSSSIGRLALAGFLAGAAVSCKYPAVLFVAVPLIVFVICRARRRSAKALAIVLTALALGCGLWFLKNWRLTGNPIYPLLSEWLGGATRTPDKVLRWARVHSPQAFGWAALGESASLVFWKSEWLSPILLPLGLLGFFVPKYRRGALLVAGYIAYVLIAWWLFTHRIDRFWVPVLPLLALLAGIGATWSAAVSWRRAVLAVLVLGLSVNFLFVTAHEVFYNAYFVKLARLRADARRARPWHLLLNEQVLPDSAVLSVGDAQVFDLTMPVFYNTAFDDSVLEQICKGHTPEEIAAAFGERRISHVYVHWGEIARYRRPGNYGGVPDFITPQWFAALVRQGVFQTPWEMELIPNQQVYPVASPAALAADSLAPPMTQVKAGGP